MLHFSDHGDEVYDAYPYFGRRGGDVFSKFVLDVPFIVWLSPAYRAQRDVSAFAGYLDRPMRLDDTIHAVMDLAELQTDLLDRTRSVFSEQWIMRPRVVNGRFYLAYPPVKLMNLATAEQEMELDQKLLSGDADAVGP